MALPFLLGSKWSGQRDRDYWERSIIGELDGFGRALGDAGPAFNTFFWMDRIRFVLFHLIDFARTNLKAIPATLTPLWINFGIHLLKSQLPNPK
jgi:hypothetical protein